MVPTGAPCRGDVSRSPPHPLPRSPRTLRCSCLSIVRPAKDTSIDDSEAKVDRSQRFHSLVFTATSLFRVAANLGESNTPRQPPPPPAFANPCPRDAPKEEAKGGALAPDVGTPFRSTPPLAGIIGVRFGGGGGGGEMAASDGVELVKRLGFPSAGSSNRRGGRGMSIWEFEMSSSEFFFVRGFGARCAHRRRERQQGTRNRNKDDFRETGIRMIFLRVKRRKVREGMIRGELETRSASADEAEGGDLTAESRC